MAVPIRMPQPGQMTEACTVLRWLKREGDAIAKGDVLFEIETDKSNMEIEAFDTGTLLRIVAGAGVTVPVDAVVAWIGDTDEEVPEVEVPEVEVPEVEVPDVEAAGAEASVSETPEAQAEVEEEATELGAPEVDAEPAEVLMPEDGSDERPVVKRPAMSPRAARAAAELGIAPASLVGTGPGGRIVERDVRAAADEHLDDQSGEPRGSDDSVATGGDAGAPLSRLRQVIARRLTRSATIPTFTVTVAVDMTGLVELRAELKAAGSPISTTDLVHAATIAGLIELPLLNARTDGTTVWPRERIHLGIAVAVPDGLLVPVIRDAHRLDLATLHDRARTAIDGARAGTLGPDMLSGSTFTVSNMGRLDVGSFTAIVNPGESGILAVSSITPEVVARGEGIAVRRMLRLTLTADHRLVDGELGARFLGVVRERLENAETFRRLASGG